MKKAGLIDISQKKATVIVACLHEEDVIGECLKRISFAMPNAEILVIHGGTDKTLEVAKEIAKTNPNIVPVYNENDQGKGHAIQVGIKMAKYDIMCQWDADLQFAPEDIPKVLEPLFKGETEIVIGSRFLPESDDSNYKFSFFRVVGNHIVNNWISLLCGCKITDVTAGSKAWTRKAIEAINFKDKGFVYEVEIPVRARKLGYEIKQVPVSYYNRQGGISGHGSGIKEIWNLIRCGYLLLWTATKIKFL